MQIGRGWITRMPCTQDGWQLQSIVIRAGSWMKNWPRPVQGAKIAQKGQVWKDNRKRVLTEIQGALKAVTDGDESAVLQGFGRGLEGQGGSAGAS
jgi:hypothetical protein